MMRRHRGTSCSEFEIPPRKQPELDLWCASLTMRIEIGYLNIDCRWNNATTGEWTWIAGAVAEMMLALLGRWIWKAAADGIVPSRARAYCNVPPPLSLSLSLRLTIFIQALSQGFATLTFRVFIFEPNPFKKFLTEKSPLRLSEASYGGFLKIKMFFLRIWSRK